MSTQSIIDRYADEQGWDAVTLLGLLVEYIGNQQNDAALDDFLSEACAPYGDPYEPYNNFDETQANAEGWCLALLEEDDGNHRVRVDTHGPACGRWNLPDYAAAFVESKAQKGSDYHKGALAIVRQFNAYMETE